MTSWDQVALTKLSRVVGERAEQKLMARVLATMERSGPLGGAVVARRAGGAYSENTVFRSFQLLPSFCQRCGLRNLSASSQ